MVVYIRGQRCNLAQIAISLNLKYKPPVVARVQFFAAEKREVQKFHRSHIRLSPCQSNACVCDVSLPFSLQPAAFQHRAHAACIAAPHVPCRGVALSLCCGCKDNGSGTPRARASAAGGFRLAARGATVLAHPNPQGSFKGTRRST